jgi:hypothetical protein
MILSDKVVLPGVLLDIILGSPDLKLTPQNRRDPLHQLEGYRYPLRD